MSHPVAHIEEDVLVTLLMAKDRSAFRSLYRSYSAAIYGVLLRILKSEELAQDVLQETFTKVWKKMHTYDRSKGRLFTWVLNIGRNHAIDILRSAHYQRSSRASLLDSPASSVEEKKSEELKIEHIGVREMVDQLSPDLRQVIDGLYFLGYSQSELAEKLGIPLGTVKSRARKAMRLLKKQFIE